MLIPHDHRNVRAVEATDLDIYKNSLYETLKATYDKLQTHKQEVALKYKEYYDKTHKPADYKIGERVLVHFRCRKRRPEIQTRETLARCSIISHNSKTSLRMN
jgi:hypothetical protein